MNIDRTYHFEIFDNRYQMDTVPIVVSGAENINEAEIVAEEIAVELERGGVPHHIREAEGPYLEKVEVTAHD